MDYPPGSFDSRNPKTKSRLPQTDSKHNRLETPEQLSISDQKPRNLGEPITHTLTDRPSYTTLKTETSTYKQTLWKRGSQRRKTPTEHIRKKKFKSEFFRFVKKHFDLGKENDRIETRRSRSVILCHLFRQKSPEYDGAGISAAAGTVARRLKSKEKSEKLSPSERKKKKRK